MYEIFTDFNFLSLDSDSDSADSAKNISSFGY